MLNENKYLGHAIAYLCKISPSKVPFLSLVQLFVINVLNRPLYNTKHSFDKCCFFYNLDAVPKNTLQRDFFIILKDLLQSLLTEELS